MNEKPKIIAGIDDATKCPCIGSIFLAGVIADEATIAHWKALGVKDSKLVAPGKREQLAQIIKKTALGFSIKQITPQMIDDKDFNLNDWEMLVMISIASQLQKTAHPEHIIVDNWETSTAGFTRRLRNLKKYSMRPALVAKRIRFDRKKFSQLSFVPEHYADTNHVIVGAASILAKTSSDKQYRSYKRIYGDFGSGNPGDPKTRLFVWQHRHNPLPIIRTSWVTFKTLLALDSIEQDPLYNRLRRIKKN